MISQILALIKNYFSRLKVMLYFKLGRIDNFHKSIYLIWLKKPRGFSTSGLYFYQSHPEINILAVRPSLSRLNNYNLISYLSPEFQVLDIGSNVGFFSMLLSSYVKHIDCVEIDKDFIEIGNKVKDYLAVNNIDFINSDIRTYHSLIKYDFVITSAVHKYLEVSLEEYLILLNDLITDGGLIFIESHPGKNNAHQLEEFINSSSYSIINSGITDDNFGMVRSFFLIRHNSN